MPPKPTTSPHFSHLQALSQDTSLGLLPASLIQIGPTACQRLKSQRRSFTDNSWAARQFEILRFQLAMALKLPRLYSSIRPHHLNSNHAHVSGRAIRQCSYKAPVSVSRADPDVFQSSPLPLTSQLIETSLKRQTPPNTTRSYRPRSTSATQPSNQRQQHSSLVRIKPGTRLTAPLQSSILSKSLLVGLISFGGLSAYLYAMSSKLVPTHPSEVMVIRNITPNVVALSVPFARFGVLKVGGRGTIGQSTRSPRHK